MVGPCPWETGASGEEGTPLGSAYYPINTFPVFPYRATLILSLEQLQPSEQTGAFFRGKGGALASPLHSYPIVTSEIANLTPSTGVGLPLLLLPGLLITSHHFLNTLSLMPSPYAGGEKPDLGMTLRHWCLSQLWDLGWI